MKKVLFIMLIAVLLVAFAAPVLADKDGPNDNACWGQIHKNIEDSGYDKVSDGVHDLQEVAKELETNFGQLVQIVKEEVCNLP